MNPETPLGAFLDFVILWLVVSIFIPYLSGWAELARYYRSQIKFDGARWRGCTCHMRWLGRYEKCVTIGANTKGIHFSVFFPFRIGHPPLFVPWHDVSVREGKTLAWKWTEFRFSQPAGVWMRFYGGLPDEIRRVAGTSWPGGSTKIEDIQSTRNAS